jgi:acyl carrier protein
MVSTQIKDFILKCFLFTDDPAALGDDQSLMSTGVLDSTGILELIHFVEETFGIKVADEEMLPENFDSVDAITAFVTRKLSRA